MTDNEIIALFRARKEEAIKETQKKYGKYLRSVAERILGNESDAEECENDVYLKTWKRIPPENPECLRVWLAALCRRQALDRVDARRAQKRGGGQTALVLEELEETLSAQSADDPADLAALHAAMDGFLKGLKKKERAAFILRYYYFCSQAEIARDLGVSGNHVGVLLFRTRNKLKKHLTNEGFTL